MNIRDIIEAERWGLRDAFCVLFPHHKHNDSLERILEAVEEQVNDTNRKQAYLEACIKSQELYYKDLSSAFQALRNEVTPENGLCSCGECCITVLGGFNNYCRKCGARLLWKLNKDAE